VSPLDELASVLAELGTDEHRVLLALARRLLTGQRSYGALDLAHDRRDWRAERAAELADALIYETFAALAKQANGAEMVQIDAKIAYAECATNRGNQK
jgi:hypothetical protein